MTKLLPILHPHVHLPRHALPIVVYRTQDLLVLLPFDLDLAPVVLPRELDLELDRRRGEIEEGRHGAGVVCRVIGPRKFSGDWGDSMREDEDGGWWLPKPSGTTGTVRTRL
jgi:hypothetical protein